MQKVGYKNNLRNNYILGITRQFFKVTVLRLLVPFIRALCASYGIVIDLKEDRLINTVLTGDISTPQALVFVKLPWSKMCEYVW